MQNNLEARLKALENATNDSNDLSHTTQIVMYDPKTGRPLTPIDERAIKYIWIPGEASELEKYSR